VRKALVVGICATALAGGVFACGGDTETAWMGHADIQTTMRYVHHVPKTDAAQRLGRLLDGENVAPNVAPSTAGQRSPKGIEHA
jgi:hypothetical protein